MCGELLWRDHEDGLATGKPQGVGPEAYLNGTSQDPTPEDARKDGHIRGRSKPFMNHPGYANNVKNKMQGDLYAMRFARLRGNRDHKSCY